LQGWKTREAQRKKRQRKKSNTIEEKRQTVILEEGNTQTKERYNQHSFRARRIPEKKKG